MKYLYLSILQISFLHISTSVRLQRSATYNFNPFDQPYDTTTPIAMISTVADEDINSKPIRSQILDKILNESIYDSRIRPKALDGTGPTEVKVGIYLRSVENVDDVRMQYSVQMTFWQEWLDPRLNYTDIQPNVTYLQIIRTKRIWMPDLFFRNEKSGYLHDLIVPNTYTRLYPNGTVLQSYRISLSLSCPMNLRAYPLDIQRCPISVGSYGWTTRDLELRWRGEDISLASDFSTPRFLLRDHTSSRCDIETPTGSYGCLVVNLEFAREFGFYLIQIYIPCSMLVIVSWVSFWLEPTAVEARVSLGVTTILTIVTQTYGINQSAPPASYAKALDIWTAWCQAMVFCALLEFASVNYFCHVQWMKAKNKMLNKKEENHSINKEEIQLEEAKLFAGAVMNAKKIDRGSRIIFPTIFVGFNIFYWIKYLMYSQYH